MDFLDEIYFDNTVRSYLIVAATILIVLILKRYLSRYIAALCYRPVHRVWKTIDKKAFIDLVVEPLEWFLVIFISIFAIDKLHFPTAFDHDIYGHTTRDIASRLGIGIIIISFTGLVLRLVDFIAMVMEHKANLTVDTRDNQLIVFFRDFLKVIIGIVGVLLIVKACFHQPIGQLLTGLSIVGAALALAAKESLENLIASFIIFFDKPFFTDDTVKVNNVIGKIEKIGLRSTRIRTPDKTLVTVPNKQMVDTMVDNWSMRTSRRAEIKLEFDAKMSSENIETTLKSLQKILADKNQEIISFSVFLKEISKNGLLVVVEYFTEPYTLKEFDTLKQVVNLEIKKMMETNNIDFASEVSTIVINNEAKEN
ncbi:mechanosensitive ion channel [Ferruginibacter lapsinanis]|uniref:mechanosensitive ion channel family protein n=1 Tax=Ferruginibacter lapsinanis TaxID=563172 RepID=UPI001E5A55E3|nr:mechanosensitive ion channel family protein [Ferruginibacter lapsinanis]UEG50970.1 mechanosensitive ion channel [Ferruginibacter lapsinanis]